MVIAGEASGDTLAAELVRSLREELACFQSRPTTDTQPLFTSLEPRFYGAGGPRMAAAGVELAEDMTAHSVFGLVDVMRKYTHFRRLMRKLVRLAIQRQPDVIVCVDFSGFNRRFARAVKDHVRARAGTFDNWNPKIVQFVSPQVWASRPGRAQAMARDFDLVLSIFPFEKAWYAERVPCLKVEFVGHPMLDRYTKTEIGVACRAEQTAFASSNAAQIVLLPGSRRREIQRHLPVMAEAAKRILAARAARFRVVLPNDALADSARAMVQAIPEVQVQIGGLAESLAQADVALASSGTVTMECAYFNVPTVVLYKLSWPEYQVGKRIVRVKFIAMPNLLANEAVFPEFIQHAATAENLANAALELLGDGARRGRVRAKLREIIGLLGQPGASRRAAREVVGLLAG